MSDTQDPRQELRDYGDVIGMCSQYFYEGWKYRVPKEGYEAVRKDSDEAAHRVVDSLLDRYADQRVAEAFRLGRFSAIDELRNGSYHRCGHETSDLLEQMSSSIIGKDIDDMWGAYSELCNDVREMEYRIALHQQQSNSQLRREGGK